MNTSCPHCKSVFRVDPTKIPAGGVRARCSICRGIFQVAAAGSPSASPPPSPAAAAVAATPSAVPAAAMVGSAPSGGATSPAPAGPPPTGGPSARPSTPPPATPFPRAPAAPAPASGTPSAAARPSPFGPVDPQAKARRLARALISDIVTYHPERRDRALGSGTLKQEFRDEIRKSWEEYVEQVGQQTAHGTPYFRDALNDLLAKGQKVF
jgi:predicted Zn finger-like uncharacterized protein